MDWITKIVELIIIIISLFLAVNKIQSVKDNDSDNSELLSIPLDDPRLRKETDNRYTYETDSTLYIIFLDNKIK